MYENHFKYKDAVKNWKTYILKVRGIKMKPNIIESQN